MSQLTVNALVESPHRVVLESPHRVKVGNGKRESITVRGPYLGLLPASISPAPTNDATTQFEYTEWLWTDARGTAPDTPYGASGAEDEYDTRLAQLLDLTLVEDWSEVYEFRDVNLNADPDTDVTDETTTSWGQFSSSNHFGGNVPPYLAGSALSGWQVWYGRMLLTRGQARYAGPKPKIPYWQGRVRYTSEAGGQYAMLRIDVTNGGWLEVTGGEVIVTTPYTDGAPFPLAEIENTARSGYFQYQAITFDQNFTILGRDAASCKQEWGVPFNEWFES